MFTAATKFHSRAQLCEKVDLNSWSATRWLTYAAQRVSVALHKTVAYELLGADAR